MDGPLRLRFRMQGHERWHRSALPLLDRAAAPLRFGASGAVEE